MVFVPRSAFLLLAEKCLQLFIGVRVFIQNQVIIFSFYLFIVQMRSIVGYLL